MDTYEAFVWEPALVKINAITAATEAACLVRTPALWTLPYPTLAHDGRLHHAFCCAPRLEAQ